MSTGNLPTCHWGPRNFLLGGCRLSTELLNLTYNVPVGVSIKNRKEFPIKSKTLMNMSPFNKLIHKSVLVVIGNSFRYLFAELFKVQNCGSPG